MAFEIVDPHRRQAPVLGPHLALLRKSGVLVLHRESLATCGISGPAVMLVDRATQRIGLRKPADGEAGLAIQVRADKGAEKLGGIAYNIKAAMARGGWGTGKEAKYHGFRQTVNRDDGLLVILLERTGSA